MGLLYWGVKGSPDAENVWVTLPIESGAVLKAGNLMVTKTVTVEKNEGPGFSSRPF
jgi:hypothetical protein